MELTSTAPGLDAFTGGKKVTVKFYVDGEKEAVATFETQLKAVDLSNATIDYTTPYQNYNGNIQRPAEHDRGCGGRKSEAGDRKGYVPPWP